MREIFDNVISLLKEIKNEESDRREMRLNVKKTEEYVSFSSVR